MSRPSIERPSEYRFGCEIGGPGQLSITEPDLGLASRLGIEPAELTTAGSWTRLFLPEDVGRVLDAINTLFQGQIWKGRVRMLARSRDLVVLDVRATPTRLPDGGVSVAVDATEITELAKLESSLSESQGAIRLLDHALSIAMWTTDETLRFTRSSGSILGEEDSLVGSSLYDWFDLSEADIPPIAAHQAALRGETTSYEVEWEGRDLRVHLGPLRDELGEVAGVIGVGVDLNVLKRVGRISKSQDVVQAQHERVHPAPDPGFRDGVLSVAGLVIDPERFEVRKAGRLIPLTVIEFRLLAELALYQGSPLSRQVLAKRVWGHADDADSPAVTMAISRLRDKVEDDPAYPTIIETVRGVGYRMTDGTGAAERT